MSARTNPVRRAEKFANTSSTVLGASMTDGRNGLGVGLVSVSVSGFVSLGRELPRRVSAATSVTRRRFVYVLYGYLVRDFDIHPFVRICACVRVFIACVWENYTVLLKCMIWVDLF